MWNDGQPKWLETHEQCPMYPRRSNPAQAEAVRACQDACTRQFTINEQKLKTVETFRYLGHFVSEFNQLTQTYDLLYFAEKTKLHVKSKKVHVLSCAMNKCYSQMSLPVL
jgi:hypothetical protein